MKTTNPPCPYCQSSAVVRNAHRPYQDASQVHDYHCKTCGKQFNEQTGTLMVRLQIPVATDALEPAKQNKM
jgi:transposase-like protein